MSNCSTTRLPREAAELNTKSQCFPSIGQNQPAFIFVLSRLGATGLKGGYIELEVAATEELFFEYLCDRSW